MHPQSLPPGQPPELWHDPGTRQRQLEMAVEQAGESIVITDAHGLITYVNPAFERTTGYARNEVLGKNPRILKSGAHNRVFYEKLWQTLARGETWRGRFVNKRKDGTLYHEEASISPVVDDLGNVVSYVAVKRDITKETDLEQQFQAAQRMESIGQLSGGIAHDFNNLIAVIVGNIDLLEEAVSGDVAEKQLREVRQAAERATDLIRQLLAFSRRQLLLPQVLDLNVVVAETETMLRRVVRENVRIVTRCDRELGRTKADPGQLQQCILNLAVNARDAMPNGGTLTLETQNASLNGHCEPQYGIVPPGDYVLVSVTDNGTGMTPEIQSRIFEPFFTTKPKGQGTGLGLATVYGIVKQSGGYIWVSSEVGKGTAFRIYLPRTNESPQPRVSTPPANLTAIENLTGIVLLVEDDANVRALMRSFLEESKLMIVEAATAEDALRASARLDCPPCLLVTDLVLPGHDGVTLAGELRRSFPSLKVLLTSGYTEQGLPDPASLKGAKFLAKPFTKRELMEQVVPLLVPPCAEEYGPGEGRCSVL